MCCPISQYIAAPYSIVAFALQLLTSVWLLFAPAIVFAEEKLAIGLLIEMSGPHAINGATCGEGFQVAKTLHYDEALAARVKLINGDSRGEAKAGVTEFQRFQAGNNLIAVITPRSQVVMALNPLSHRSKIPLIGIAGATHFIGQNPYAFRFWPSTEMESAALAHLAMGLKKKTAALVSLEDEWPLSLREHFLSQYQAEGGKIVFDQIITADEQDFSTIVSKLGPTKPDLIFANLGTSQTPTLIKKLRSQKIQAQVFTNFWGALPPVILAAGNENVEGNIFVEPAIAHEKFRRAFSQEYPNSKANSVGFSCYAALASALEIVRKHQVHQAADFFQALQTSSAILLPDGPLEIKNREVVFPLAFRQIRNGQPSDLPSPSDLKN